MILEAAPLSVRPDQTGAFEAAFREAQSIIASMPGYLSHELQHCVERPNEYLLLVRWRSLADHEKGFRQSAGYQDWKRLLHRFYDPFPTVLHYAPVEGVPIQVASVPDRTVLETLIDRYCAGWSAPTRAERAALLDSVLTADARYCDPGTDGPLDRTALLDYIDAIQARWPGATVMRTTRIDGHHDLARFGWQLIAADGSRLPEGVDVVAVAGNPPRLARIDGFFGALKAR